MVSGNPGGRPNGAQCLKPNDCEVGLSCVFGICDESTDEAVGWGMASVYEEIVDGGWACFAAGDGSGRPCALSNDGTCGRPRTPATDIDPLELPGVSSRPPSPPSDVGVSIRARPLDSPTLSAGQAYRGVYSWSSCPEPITTEAECQTEEDCPKGHRCFGAAGPFGGRCDPTDLTQRRRMAVVDFNVAVLNVATSEWTWLSYSRDDNMEAFEFVAPNDGQYHFLSFADRDDWSCDESTWLTGGRPAAEEWDAFVGGSPLWLRDP